MKAHPAFALACSILSLVCHGGRPVYSQNSGPTIRGVISDAYVDNLAVKGAVVVVYSLDQNGNARDRLGRSGITKSDGGYTVACDKKARRIVVEVADAEKLVRGFGYAPVGVSHLSGLKDMTLNPAVPKEADQTMAEKRATMGFLGAIAPVLEDKELDAVASYVEHAVVANGSNADYGFGSELSILVDKLSERQDRTGALSRHAWYIDKEEGDLMKWKLPEDVTSPAKLILESVNVLGDNENGNAVGSFNVAPCTAGLYLIQNREEGGRLIPYSCMLPPDGSRSKWTRDSAWKDVTSASGVAARPLLVKGNADGAIEVSNTDHLNDKVVFEIGRTPVTATAVSRDGRLCGGVTIDGSYMVWRLNKDLDVGKAKLVREGKLPRAFPNAIAFSPDGKSLLVGTGLRKSENGIVVVNLTGDATAQPTVLDTPSAVTRIEFGTDSETFIANMAGGELVIFQMNSSAAGLDIKEVVKIEGIDAFGVVPERNAAIIKVSGDEEPVVFPFIGFLDKDTFHLPGFGIKKSRQ